MLFDSTGSRTRASPHGSDLGRLLASWRRSILALAPYAASGAAGAAAMRFAHELLRALEAAGAPFERSHEPRRIASG